MKKIKYYLETSVFNFVFADDEPKRRDLTKKYFNVLQKEGTTIYSSTILIDELNAAPEPIKGKLLSLLEKYRPVILALDDEVRELANKYIEEKIIP